MSQLPDPISTTTPPATSPPSCKHSAPRHVADPARLLGDGRRRGGNRCDDGHRHPAHKPEPNGSNVMDMLPASTTSPCSPTTSTASSTSTPRCSTSTSCSARPRGVPPRQRGDPGCTQRVDGNSPGRSRLRDSLARGVRPRKRLIARDLRWWIPDRYLPKPTTRAASPLLRTIRRHRWAFFRSTTPSPAPKCSSRCGAVTLTPPRLRCRPCSRTTPTTGGGEPCAPTSDVTSANTIKQPLSTKSCSLTTPEPTARPCWSSTSARLTSPPATTTKLPRASNEPSGFGPPQVSDPSLLASSQIALDEARRRTRVTQAHENDPRHPDAPSETSAQ